MQPGSFLGPSNGSAGLGERGMKYYCVRDTGSQAVWVVEAADDDAGVSTAIFVGKKARQRAEEYAAWKNGSLDPEGLGKPPEQPKAA